MALSPIQLFRSNESSLAQILQGGNQAITGIMDRAIQIGRDLSNKQLAQERDMLGMRQQETAMAQRRAENLQQNNEDAQNFARRAFESNRRYGLELAQEGRAAVKDVFSMGAENRRIDLAKEQLALSRTNAERSYALNVGQANRADKSLGFEEERLKLTRQEAEQERQAQQSEQDWVRDTLTRKSYPGPMSTTPQDEVDRYFNLRSVARDSGVSPQQRAAAERQIFELERSNPALAGGDGGGAPKELSPSEQRMQRKEARDLFDEDISANPNVFAYPFSAEQKAIKAIQSKVDGGDKMTASQIVDTPEFKKAYPKEWEAMANRVKEGSKFSDDKGNFNQKAWELAAIRAAKSEEAYVKAQKGISKAEEELRRRNYRRVMGGAEMESGAPAAPSGLSRFFGPSGVD